MTGSECTEKPQERDSVRRFDSTFGEPGSLAGYGTELPATVNFRSGQELKYHRTYFPLGYPVRVACNSMRVLEVADQSWKDFELMFGGDPLEILLELRDGGGANESLPPAPSHRLDDALLLQIADPDNFFIVDLKRGRATARVTPTVLACPRYLRYFFLEGMALSMISSMHAVPVHAACVRVGGKGVLLCGDSGDGKSTLAYAGARAGWTYVSDDATYMPIHRKDRMVIGNCSQIRFRPSAVSLFPELVGKPITPRAAGKPSVEVRTSIWPEIAAARSTQVDYVVFLNRRCVEVQELRALRSSDVLPWFKRHILSSPDMRAAQEAALSRLLETGLFELRYHELGWAIRRIEELAEKGL